MKLAVCILAKDEAATIGGFLAALSRQTLLHDRSVSTTVFVAANGSTDDTAAQAANAAGSTLAPMGINYRIFDFAEPGKSRTWNRLVHREMPGDFDFVAFIDADITFIGDDVLERAVRALNERPAMQAYSGFPIKNVAARDRKGILDQLSLKTSDLTRYVGGINGSLYVIRSACLASIWLPDETPGEDGFINAMVDTNGFTRASMPGAIAASAVPTHYFEAHSPLQFFAHERRMIVGTMINCWIFEYLWSLKLSEPAGPIIDRLNNGDPRWVENLIAERVNSRKWVIPASLILRRMRAGAGKSLFQRVLRFPVLLAATVLTVPPAVMANRVLRRRGAATIW
ncbi:MAG: glycosyltransferase family 2 protein [Proteobacteria bacterium]|nr:glycosyltransferase family 2 protein [Pseudomonadota bacterium]